MKTFEFNELSIGKDQVIEGLTVDLTEGDPVSIDALLEPTLRFWEALESNCVAECCGLEAMDLWPQPVALAARKCRVADLSEKLQVLRAAVQELNAQVLLSHRVNQFFEQSMLLQLTDYLIGIVAESANDPVGIGASLNWMRGEQEFLNNKYSRTHHWSFDGGLTVAASSSPDVVPIPMSDPSAVDPEEAFVASLASCHMLWFLALAAKAGFVVDSYDDHAEGMMSKNDDRKIAVTLVTLNPKVSFSGEAIPGPKQIDKLHAKAHDHCFIANSVKTEIRINPILDESQR